MSLGLASDAVDSASVVPHTSESQDEREGLLEKMVARVIKNPRTLAIFYGVCNLSNFLIGAGILGLTSVFASGGWLSGFILFAIFGFATWFSLDLLLESGCSTNCFSYEGLGFTVGGWTLQLFVKIIIIIDSYGFLAAYLNVAGKTLLTVIWDDPTQASAGANFPALTAWVTIALIMPLCFLKDMSYLGFTSFLSLLPLIYMYGFEMFYIGANGVPSTGFAAVKGSSAVFFTNLPTIVFAYSCQQGLFPIFSGLICKDAVSASNLASQSKSASELFQYTSQKSDMRKINAWAVFLTFLLYMLSATLGYLAFPTTAAGSLLDMYPDSAAIDTLRILMAISVILSYPIILFPTRENVDKLMFSGQKSCFAARPLTNVRFYSQNIILCWIAYGITVAIPQFRTILNLWGAFTGTFLGYIFPTVFYLKTSKIHFKADKKAWAALFMLIVGSLAGFTSLYFVIADQVSIGSL